MGIGLLMKDHMCVYMFVLCNHQTILVQTALRSYTNLCNRLYTTVRHGSLRSCLLLPNLTLHLIILHLHQPNHHVCVCLIIVTHLTMTIVIPFVYVYVCVCVISTRMKCYLADRC